MTKSQAKLYIFIKKFIKKNGYSPTYEQMAKGINLKSKSGIHIKLTSLKKANKIDWTKAIARSVEIVEIIDIEH
jgi:repressor LexA|tara:strand:- start:6707 stop:6928 length:222 start_codon:yes stop_codon:yes gene_type:complete